LAFIQAIKDISDGLDEVVVFPKGTTYYIANCTFTEAINVLIQIDGEIIVSNDISQYPIDNGGGRTPVLYFVDSTGITIAGSGKIDGQGLNWWRLAYSGNDNRPNLLDFSMSTYIDISMVSFFNSPAWSIRFEDCAHIVIRSVTIFIDSEVTRLRNRTSVTYALNTDGIDIAADNVTVYDSNITNYDDAIVAKPCRSTWLYCQCSGRILAYNNTIMYSTGLAIGSVPPNTNTNCVRNVTFRDSFLNRPLKALYIKSNPGNNGVGIVEDITYENIRIHAALWWTIWVGPQQQNQPKDNSSGITLTDFFHV
jgi:polygalacturonase